VEAVLTEETKEKIKKEGVQPLSLLPWSREDLSNRVVLASAPEPEVSTRSRRTDQ
jgi:hypothetical protein